MDLVLPTPESILYILQKILEIGWLIRRKRKYKNRGHRLLGRVLGGYLQDELFMGSPVHSTVIQGCCLEVSVLFFNRFTVLETHFPNSHKRDGSRFSLYSYLPWLTELLEQVAQGSCEVSILADVKSLNGYGPQTPAAPVDSGLNMGVGPDILQRFFLSSVTQWIMVWSDYIHSKKFKFSWLNLTLASL